MPRLVPWLLVAVTAVGCNALTGVGDFNVADDLPGRDGGMDAVVVPPIDAMVGEAATVGDDDDVPDANADADASAADADADASPTCGPNFLECNGDPSDGCEVDKRTDINNCGSCKHGCTATAALCVSGACTAPASCKELRAVLPTTPSGNYTIDPDGVNGSDAPFVVYCDMAYAAGGWTVIFAPQPNLSSSTLDYTSSSNALLKLSTEVLLAYRSGARAVTGSAATFALPSPWRGASPFKAIGADLLDIPVTIDGVPPSGTTTVRFGYGNFADTCADPWITDDGIYGRLCIVGTTAPFYNAFAAAGIDNCPTSAQQFDAIACSTSRQFTIAVR